MSSSGLTHNQVFMRNKTVLTSLSLRLQFFVTGIFSTFNVVKLTNNFGASQEPNEKQEYLQMSMAAHAAEAAGLRLGCSRSQRVLRRAAEGSAPPLTGAGERLARLGPGRHPRPHPIPLPRQHLAPTAGQRPRGRQRGTRGTRCHTASLRERARKRAAVGGDGGEKGGRACPSTAQNGSPGPGVRPLGRAGPRSRRGPAAGAARAAVAAAGGPYSPSRPGLLAGRAGPGWAARSRRYRNTMAAERDRPAARRGYSQLSRELRPHGPAPAERARRGRSPGGILRAVGGRSCGRELKISAGSDKIAFCSRSCIPRDSRIVFHVQPENCNMVFKSSVYVTFSSLPEPCK